MSLRNDQEFYAARNTDREIWREREGDYYADSMFATENGTGIGINCGGHVIVKPVREWHKLALVGVQRPEDVARIVEIVNTSLGPLNATECADLGEEIAAVLALPHTGQPQEGGAPDCWGPWRALADAPVVPTKTHLKSTKLFLGSRYGSVGDAREIFQGDGFANQCVAVAINGDVAERLVCAANGQPQEGIPLQEFQAVQDAALAEFVRWCIEESFDGLDVDGSSIQSKAVKLGILSETKYDPEIHGESAEAAPGDQWYTIAPWLSASPPPPVAESGWQEIETAPKQIGKFIILYCPEDNSRWLASWQTDRWYGVDDCGLTRNGLGWTITHWRPLPAPPHIADQRPEAK